MEVGEHRDIKGHLVDRGEINKAADKVRLCLCNTWVTRVIDEFTYSSMCISLVLECILYDCDVHCMIVLWTSSKGRSGISIVVYSV